MHTTLIYTQMNPTIHKECWHNLCHGWRMTLELSSLDLTLGPPPYAPCLDCKHSWWVISWCECVHIYVAVVCSALVYHINYTEDSIAHFYSFPRLILWSGISGHPKYIPIGSQHGNFFKFVAFITRQILLLTITTCTYRIFSFGSILRYLYMWITLFLSLSHTHPNMTQGLRLSQVLTASIW